MDLFTCICLIAMINGFGAVVLAYLKSLRCSVAHGIFGIVMAIIAVAMKIPA